MVKPCFFGMVQPWSQPWLTLLPATVFCDVYRQRGGGVKIPQAYLEF